MVAITLDIKLDLGLHAIYLEIIKDLPKSEKTVYFFALPMLASTGEWFTKEEINIELELFGFNILRFLKFLEDAMTYLCYSIPPLCVDLGYNHEYVETNNYLALHELQLQIAEITNLDPKQISFNQ